MTPELEARWRAGEIPFDGRAVVTVDDPALAELLSILRLSVESLQCDHAEILEYRDWHEHDGYVTSSRDFNWAALSPALQSTEALYSARDEDEFVRIAIHPPTFDWLLRFNIDDADSAVPAEAWCSFDFSCSAQSPSNRLLDEIHSKWPGYTDVLSAREYFDNAYAG